MGNPGSKAHKGRLAHPVIGSMNIKVISLRDSAVMFMDTDVWQLFKAA